MSVRKILFWVHLVCGVVAGVVILIMCVTGALLTYQRQMTAWADMRSYRAVPPDGAVRLPVETLAAKVRDAQPVDGDEGPGPMTLTLRADPAAPASVAMGPRTLFVQPYTGEVLGEGAVGVRAFFRRVTDWHRWLAASNENRATGRKITGASNLLFLIIVASGPFLWWPKTFSWKQVRSIAWFKGGLSSKARDFNWHNTIGIWSLIPLLVVVWSGVVISYPWATNLVYRAAGEQPPAPGGGREGGPGPARGAGPNGRAGGNGGRGGGERGAAPGRGGEMARAEASREAQSADAPEPADADRMSIDALIARAAVEHPAWRTIGVRFPLSASGPVSLTVDEGDGGQPQKRGTLVLDATTGEVVRWESQAGATPGRRARSWLRFAHTGEVYGIPGQTVAGLVTAGGAVLVWTGLALTYRRFVSWRRRKRSRDDTALAA